MQDQAVHLRGGYQGIIELPATAGVRPLGEIVARRQAGSRSRIGVTVHHALADAEIAWRAFEHEAIGLGFQTFDWIKAWHVQVGAADGVEPAIAFVSLDGVPVMLAAFGIERRYGLRCLTWLGGKFVDYNAPMLSPDFAERVSPEHFAVMWQKVLAQLPPHDFIVLENQPSHIGATVNPFVTLAGDVAPDKGYVFELPETVDEFYAAFRSETRRQDRAKWRKLEALGALEFRIAANGEEARRMAADILDRKASKLREQGVASIFEDAGYCAAYIALAALPPKRQLLQVAMLTLNGEFLAGSIAHVFRGHATLMVHTFEGHPRQSPGRLHLLRLMETSIEAGHLFYDLSIGKLPFKESFCAEPMALTNFVVATKPWGLAAANATRAKFALKRRVKASARLMQWLRSFRLMLK
ncbi:MAG: GNAT family N-acetyltransferase [Parvibaculum sp.]|nr:GNAT family N-acetyltransferase [Parvibaculum sp.]